MENVYRGDWSEEDDMLREFCIEPEVLEGVEILYAWYEYESYSGSALVLYRKDGKLYEVNGSHCSCFGLEEQWDPEETNVEAISLRGFYDLSDDERAGLMKLLLTL